MACHPFGTKLLNEPTDLFSNGHRGTNQRNMNKKYRNSHSRKCIPKCCLQCGGHFVQTQMQCCTFPSDSGHRPIKIPNVLLLSPHPDRMSDYIIAQGTCVLSSLLRSRTCWPGVHWPAVDLWPVWGPSHWSIYSLPRSPLGPGTSHDTLAGFLEGWDSPLSYKYHSQRLQLESKMWFETSHINSFFL